MGGFQEAGQFSGGDEGDGFAFAPFDNDDFAVGGDAIQKFSQAGAGLGVGGLNSHSSPFILDRSNTVGPEAEAAGPR